MKMLACFVLFLEDEKHTCAYLFGDEMLLCDMPLFEGCVAGKIDSFHAVE